MNCCEAATSCEIGRTVKLSRLRCKADGKVVGRDFVVDCSGHSSKGYSSDVFST